MDDQRAESQPAVELTIDTSDERVLDAIAQFLLDLTKPDDANAAGSPQTNTGG